MGIRTMSAAGRARIAAAQPARPAKVKSKKAAAISAPKRTMSLTSRKISRSSSESTMGEVAKSEKEGLAFVSLSRCISEPKGHSSVLGAASQPGIDVPHICLIMWAQSHQIVAPQIRQRDWRGFLQILVAHRQWRRIQFWEQRNAQGSSAVLRRCPRIADALF
jgi:hypothetical protein